MYVFVSKPNRKSANAFDKHQNSHCQIHRRVVHTVQNWTCALFGVMCCSICRYTVKVHSVPQRLRICIYVICKIIIFIFNELLFDLNTNLSNQFNRNV